MSEAPDRIWAKLVPDQFGPSGFGLIVDHAAFDGAVEFVPRAELEAAVLAEREINPLVDGDPRGTVWILPLTPLGADNFGVCIGGRWDGWLMWRHPDGQWVSKSKLTAIDPFSAAIRSQGEKK